MYWDQYITWFQRHKIFQINMATWHWCLRCQSCTRASGLKHCSHSRLTSWHVVTIQWVCCKAVLVGGRTNFYSACQRKQTCLKKYQPGQSPQQKQSELDGRMTPDLISGYFWQVSMSCPSVKLSKFCGGRNALKVINERCITTSLDVAKVHSLITFNES